VIIVAGAAVYRVGVGPLTAQPSVVSKMNTLCQAAFVLCVVAHAQLSQPPDWVETGVGALVFATTVVSGIDYALTYGRRFAAARAHLGAHGAKS
jgi:cardiolipin synthase